MQQRPPQKPQMPNWSGLSKNLALWLLVALLAVAIVQLMGKTKGASGQLNYTEFSQQLDAGNIKAVEVYNGKEVKGDFRRPIPSGTAQVTSFTVLLPVANDAVMLKRLEQAGVTITAKEPKSGIVSVLLAMLSLDRDLRDLVRADPADAVGRQPGLLLRKIQGQAAGGRYAEGHLRRCGRRRRGQGRAPGDHRVPEGPPEIHPARRPAAQGRAAGRSAGHRQDAARQGRRGRGGTSLLLDVGLDFVEMFVGVGASRVRDLFEQGKAHAPCIIFIDEIDAVGRHRGAGLGGGHDEREQTLNQLLVEMDGFESNDGVILVAATNRPDVLDPALLRPGRFDRMIVVDAPDVRGREGILRVHTRKIPLSSDVRLETLAKGTPGLTGADLANLVNEAAVLAARRNKTLVDMSDFEDAKDKVMLGVERRSLVLTEDERKLTAYHEAGHAIVSLKLPGSDPLHKVTIIPRGRALGLTVWLPDEDRHNYTKDWLEGRLACAFGGRVAEELVFGPDKVTTGASNDIEQATGIARRMVTQFGMSDKIGVIAVGDREQEIFLGREIGHRRDVSDSLAQMVDSEVKRIVDESYERARGILSQNRELLDRFSLALLERETLDRDEMSLLNRGEPLPPRAAPPPPLPPPPKTGASPAAVRTPMLGAPPAEPAGA